MSRPDVPAAWESELERTGRVEVGYRHIRTVVLGVVTVLLALGGLLVAASADSRGDRVTGTLGALVFGAVAVVLVRRGAQSGPAVVVTADAVGAPARGWSLPWEHVYGAFVFRSRGTSSVLLAVEPDRMAHHLAATSRTMRVRAAGNRRLLGLEAVSLPTPLAVDADAFATWLTTKARARPREEAEG